MLFHIAHFVIHGGLVLYHSLHHIAKALSICRTDRELGAGGIYWLLVSPSEIRKISSCFVDFISPACRFQMHLDVEIRFEICGSSDTQSRHSVAHRCSLSRGSSAKNDVKMSGSIHSEPHPLGRPSHLPIIQHHGSTNTSIMLRFRAYP